MDGGSGQCVTHLFDTPDALRPCTIRVITVIPDTQEGVRHRVKRPKRHCL